MARFSRVSDSQGSDSKADRSQGEPGLGTHVGYDPNLIQFGQFFAFLFAPLFTR